MTGGLIVLISGCLGYYFGGYLKKKGENLATHEDIDKLVPQVAAVTQAAKGIEAEISSDVWDRQKRWEMKRDVLFSAARAFASLDDTLTSYGSVFAHKEEPDNLALSEARNKSSRRWFDVSTKFDEARLLVATVCSKETKEAFDSLALVTSEMSQNITRGEWDIYKESRKALALKCFALQAAVRK